jgi:signal transduction histidine kinase
MLRSSLYRRVVLIAMGAGAFVALALGVAGYRFVTTRMEAERSRVFADMENRVGMLERLVSFAEEDMLKRGESALLELSARYGGGSGLAGLSAPELAAEAARLDVDDIYLIGENNRIVATSFAPDLGLDLGDFNPRFKAFVEGLKGSGKIAAQRLSVSTKTGAVGTYQYYGAAGSPYLIEVSCLLDKAFPRRLGGMGYGDFIKLDFENYLEPEPAGELKSFDIIGYSKQGSWSFIRPGVRREIDRELIRAAFAEGEAQRTEGARVFYYRPIRLEAAGSGFADRMVAELEIDRSSFDGFASSICAISLIACLAAGLLGLIAAKRFFERSFVARIEALEGAMRRVSGGDRSFSFDSSGEDEISSIGRGIDSMLREVRASEEKIRAARMAEATGLMAGGVAHDVNNFLAGAVGTASLLKLKLDEDGSVAPEELRASLELIEKSGQRGAALVRDLFALARNERRPAKPFDLSRLLEELVTLLRAQAPDSVTVSLELPPEPAIARGEEKEIERVVINLCRNGIQAMTDMRPPEEKRGGLLSLKLLRPNPFFYRLEVADRGVGIAPEVLSRLFTPFFSTKTQHGGSGLGLAASKAIAEAYGGRIEAANRESGGAVFALILPAAP